MQVKIVIGVAIVALFALLFVTSTHATFNHGDDHCKKDCHEVSPTSNPCQENTIQTAFAEDNPCVTPTDTATPSATLVPPETSSGGSDGRSDGRSDGSCSQPPCVTNQSGMPLQPASNSPK